MIRVLNLINRCLGAVIVCLLMGATITVDPTRPPDSLSVPGAPVVSQQPVVTAIFTYPTYRLAIVNGRGVKVGDRVGEYIVTTITPFTVELLGSSQTKEILKIVPAVKQDDPEKGI